MRRTKEDKNCPYCLSPVQPDEDRVRCPRCGVIHHADCWKANGQCSVYGCDGWVVWSSQISEKLRPVPPGRVEVTRAEIEAGPDGSGLCIKCGAPVGPKQIVCWKCRQKTSGARYFENCFGPTAVLAIAAVSGIVLLVRAIT